MENLGLDNAIFLDFEESRIISNLSQMEAKLPLSKKDNIISIIEIWNHEVFSYLLEVQSSTVFRKIEYFCFQESKGISNSNLQSILEKIKFIENPEIILISKFEENLKIRSEDIEKTISKKVPGAKVLYFDPDIRRGTIVKAKSEIVSEESNRKKNVEFNMMKSNKENNFSQSKFME